MKRILLTLLPLLCATAGFACTNLIVGKDASVDGSVICTYNCDGISGNSGWTIESFPTYGSRIRCIAWIDLRRLCQRGDDFCQSVRTGPAIYNVGCVFAAHTHR